MRGVILGRLRHYQSTLRPARGGLMKRLLFVAIGLIVVGGAAWLALTLYLRSAGVRQQVVARLEQVYGGPVRLAAVHVGAGASSLTDLQLFEAGSDRDDTPWLRVKSVHTDLSLWQLARGIAVPGYVQIEEATVLLHFSSNGALATQLPEFKVEEQAEPTMPRVTLAHSRIILRKDGHPDLVVTDVTASLKPDAGTLALAGTGHHATAGTIHVDGTYDGAAKQVQATLTTEDAVHVEQSLLEALPLVPADVWRELTIRQATAAAKLNFSYTLPTKQLNYRVE